MFCRECGSQLREGALFCTNCGKKLTAQTETEKPKVKKAPEQPVMKKEVPQREIAYSGPASPVGGAAQNGRVSFIKAVKLYFKNYVNFMGRASRSEFWWACLFNFLVGLVAGFIPVLGNLVLLALFIPSLSLAIRRLHDTGRSWCYYLMILIPFAGPIILVVQYCKKSDGDNQWGLGSKAAGAAMSGNVSTPEAKRMQDAALVKIVPAYDGTTDLARAMMQYAPQTIKDHIAAADTDTLLMVDKALGYYIDREENADILNMVRQNVRENLQSRI